MPSKHPIVRIEPDAADNVLTISPDKVCFFIVKAREFDAKEEPNDPDPGSNPSDDDEIEVLEDQPDDPVLQELTSFIGALSIDERIDLVALAWLGRGDYEPTDWPQVRAEAASESNKHTARYLLGMPLLGDYLEEGLDMLGYSCTE
jgi:hypothetical protein